MRAGVRICVINSETDALVGIAVQDSNKGFAKQHAGSCGIVKGLVTLSILLCLATPLHAQLWSGVLSSSRAINWTNAGAGSIPARTTICSTIQPYGSSQTPGSPLTINNAIASCQSGETVLLSAGTFYLNAPIDFAGKSNVTLRGSGADQTKIVLISSANPCYNGIAAGICVMPEINAGTFGNITAADWTAGYSAGTTTITLSTTSGLSVGMLMALDQCDDGFNGSGAGSNWAGGCGTGSNSDSGNVWNCVSPTDSGGVCSSQKPGGGARTNRSQQQWVVVAAISGSQVTFTPGLYMANWRGGQSPGAWWPTVSGTAALYVTGDGVENLTLDMTQYTVNPSLATAILFDLAYNSWASGNRLIYTERNHVFLYQAAHITVANNYMFGTLAASSESYGVENYLGSDNLVINNIGQHIVTPFIAGGADEGDVWVYNYDTDDYYNVANWLMPGNYQHAAGTAMDLWEGNESSGFISDAIHGTHNLTTIFRNYYIGNQPSCYGLTCTQEIFAVQPEYVTRYFNVVGNVLGQSQVHTLYNDNPASGSSTGGGGIYAIYAVGWAGNNGTYDAGVASANDMLSVTSLMRWGNYDTVTGATRWCGNSSDPGWTTTCNSVSEVPINFNDSSGSPSLYVNPVPSSNTLASSWFLNIGTHPNGGTGLSWWKVCTNYPTCSTTSIPPFPPNGPDVTGGNIPGVGGHANSIPAKLAYNTLPVDTSYQGRYTISAASCSVNTVTLTVATLPEIPQGEFTVSGVNPAGYNGTFQVTGTSSTTSVSYPVTSCPGSYISGGNVLYPNVRSFNSHVYMNDPVTVSAPTVVQTPCTHSTYATNPTLSCTFGSNVTSGDILVVWIYADSQITISAPSGCVSSWSVIGSPTNQQAAYIGTANATGTCSITVSGLSSSAGCLAAVGYDLQNAISATDGVNYSSFSYCTSCLNGSITTSTNNDLVLGFVFQGSGTVTIGSPFTSDFSGNAQGIILAAGHYALATAGNTNMSWSDSGSGGFSATLAVKP